MAVIDRFRNITTVFEVFELPSSKETEFIQNFSEFIQSNLKMRPGFVSYNLHRSDDGYLFNYGQWKSSEDYESFLNDSEIKDLRDAFYSKLVRATPTKVTFTT